MAKMSKAMPMGGAGMGKSMKLGGGGRFAALKSKIAKGGARDPGAVAAAIGRAKYGGPKMARMAAAGRVRNVRSA